MISKGNLLKFIPPILAGGEAGDKARYMLVVDYDKIENVIKMLNVSSLKGKEHKLLYLSNKEIDDYFPLPVPSFVKIDTIYFMSMFKDIEKYIAFNGNKMSIKQVDEIENSRLEYMKNNRISSIEYTGEEFYKFNT